jgi:radical SAM superfamily enzyme YgiQ (UPF0313 family)
MDDERAVALKQAGCWVVAFGFEHGDEMMLKNMCKGQHPERAFEAVRACRKAGLLVHGFFLAGLPWETQDTLKTLFNYVKKLNTDFFDFNIACPLPGTELYSLCEQENLFVNDGESTRSYAHAGVRTYTLTAKELTIWRRNALLRLYMRPTYICRTLYHAVQMGTLGHYIRAAMMRLKTLFRNLPKN